ncbi:unnamed protein product, partial [Trichobilharzia regenti]
MFDCVSPRWKADEHCIEFWNGISRSSGVETLSYGDFQKYSDELVELFRRHLIFAPNNSNRTPVVAIIWAPHILTSVVTHGIVKSGIPFFPILSSSASSGLRPLIDHIDAIVWLCNPIDVIPIDGFLNYQATSTNTLDSVFSRDDWCLLLRSSLSSSSKADIFANPFTLPNSHLAYIISTSGSFSDERKLVCVADSCLTANILDLGMRFPSDDHCSPEENSVVLASPLTFDPSIVQIYFSLLSHRTLVMCPSSILSQSKALSLLCINANVDWLQCTPSQLSGLDRHLLKRLLSQPRLKVLLGGEPFPLNEFINIKKYKATLYNIYGTTEVSSWSHLFKVNGPDEDLTNDDIYFSSHGKLIYRPYRVFKFSTLAKSRLISVWKESLGLDNMNILDKRLTFLEAGGSSLMALNLIETIIQEFPNLTNRRNKLLSSIFTHPFSRICQLILRSSHTSTRPRKHPTKFSSFKETDQSKSSDVEMNIEYRHQSPFSLYTSGSSLHLSNLLHRDAIRLIWRHDLLKCVDASPVIISGPDRLMDGCAFVGSHSGLFSAIRVPDGCPLWSDSSVPISGRIEASCAYAYMGSTSILTVGTLSGNICALDIEQGTVLCSYDTGGAVKSPTTYIHDYRFLVCGSHSKLIHAVDLRSLTEMRPVWTNPFDGSPIVSPITVSRTSDTNTPYLVVASLGGSFGCLDPRNPANLVWMQHAKIPIFNKPLLYFDSNNKVNIIIAAVSGRIQSWSLLNGTLNWSYECSKELNGHAIFSDPVFDCQSNSVIISTNKGFMFALNVLS